MIAWMKWVLIIEAAFILGMASLTVAAYWRSPKRWHILCLGVSYSALCGLAVWRLCWSQTALCGWQYWYMVIAFGIGDVGLYLLTGKAGRAFRDRLREMEKWR